MNNNSIWKTSRCYSNRQFVSFFFFQPKISNSEYQEAWVTRAVLPLPKCDLQRTISKIPVVNAEESNDAEKTKVNQNAPTVEIFPMGSDASSN